MTQKHCNPAVRADYLREVMKLVLTQHRTWRWIAVAALIEALFALASPWIAARAIDSALPNSAQSLLGALAILIVAAAFYTAWARWLHERATLVLERRLETQCLTEVVKRYLATPYPRLLRADFGATNETVNAASTVVLAMVRLVAECATLVASGAVGAALLAFYHPALAAITLGGAGFLAVISALLSLREAHHAKHVMEASARCQDLLNTLLGAVPTLRISGATGRFTRRWEGLFTDQVRGTIEREKARLGRSAMTLGGQRALSFAATAWLAHQALQGTLSIGVLMTCTMLVSNFLRVALSVTESLVGFLVMRPYLARVNALLGEADTGGERPGTSVNPAALAPDVGLVLQSVWFRYDDAGRWVLEGHTQTFPVAQHTVLRAASGAGKSTILRLLAGLLVPEGGEVSVLGCDPASTRGLVAYLPQQTTLFEGSIAANLTTLSGAPLERVLQVGELTGLARMIRRLPMGVETLVSAAGGNLSAGQRQLVALTAAFATGCPVVLLDEATSQLDALSQASIQWSALVAGRTVVSVHHA